MAQRVKTQVVFPKHLLRELNQATASRERSEFVVAATRKELDRLKFKRTLKKVAGAWSTSAHPALTTHRGVRSYIKSLRRPLAKRAQRFRSR